ncbi:MAG: thiamine pyrophosphate-requiring protein, partial [Chloroflexi bacterium]|nr:thiamine pyrophosphate-requiring protein [Chloroflexota bacterium]
RTGLHMVDAFGRLNSGQRVGVFAMQSGPGTENSFGGVAQAYSEASPMVVIAGGYSRALSNVEPHFSALVNFQHITKWCEQVTVPQAVPEAVRRAFNQARNGRPGPALLEVPGDVFQEEIPDDFEYFPSRLVRSGPDPRDITKAAQALVQAERPVIYAGQGVHYARAWDALRELAELLEAPVTTSLQGKSAFPENHPLSLGSGGRSLPAPVHHFLQAADVVFGIGCSFTATNYGLQFPRGKTYIHATLDPLDLNKNLPSEHQILGDAELVLRAMIDEVRSIIGSGPRGRRDSVAAEIEEVRAPWHAEWSKKLRSDETPLSPYRVISDLLATVDGPNTIVTHDAGSPRDQMSPFWQSTTPLSYLGWGKTTQLGYGLGLAMGAKLTHPDKLCINVWGDAAIGFTGMDFETAVRERIPIMSVLLNNFSMAIELGVMPVSTEKFRSTDISGHYADFARAMGGYGERVTAPDEIVPAIRRGIEQTQQGHPVLLEFITAKETETSVFR